MEPESGVGLERLTMFSDGVFAIAITLLVLPLTDAEIDGEHVGASLVALLPQIFSFVLSFAVIGRYWLLHHQLFSRIARADVRLMGLNLAYLFCVAFLPFPTSLLGEQGNSTAATVLYAVNLIAIVAMSVLMSWYSGRHPRMVADWVTAAMLRSSIGRGLAPGLAFVPSIPLAFVSPTWAKVSWILILPFSIVADRLFPEE